MTWPSIFESLQNTAVAALVSTAIQVILKRRSESLAEQVMAEKRWYDWRVVKEGLIFQGGWSRFYPAVPQHQEPGQSVPAVTDMSSGNSLSDDEFNILSDSASREV